MSGQPAGRRWLVTAAVAVAVLLASGGTSYAIARSHGKSGTSQSCDVHKCIPRLKAATVVEALTERGYTCSANLNQRRCQLRAGVFYFDSTLQVSEELITRIHLRVFREASAALTPRSVAYLTWFGTLPYRDDPRLTGQIEAWVSEQVEAQKDAKATIGDYEYTLTVKEPHDVLIEIKGTYA